MAAIITEKFRLHNAEQFYESLSESSADTYYIGIGKPISFTSDTSGGTDLSPPTPVDDVSSEYYLWDSMIAAKKLTSSDVSYVIPRRNWANSTTYDMYEHNISSSNTTTSGATNLYDSTFYFMTSDYKVYKVLDNNGGTNYSGAEPSSTSTAPHAIGGYVLQYMYTLTSSEVANFLTTDYIPVSTDSTVSSAATDGAIDSVIVTAGSGYTNGTYYAPVHGDGTSSGTSSGAIIRITIASNAIASFGLTAGTDTTIHAAGSGYTHGTVSLASSAIYSDADLSTATNVGGGSGGAVSVVIGPKEGHGDNAVKELGGHYVMLHTTLTQAEGDDFLTGNDFRQVSLLQDPYNYGTTTVSTATTLRSVKAIKLASGAGSFQADEKITQATSGAVGKVVEYDSTLRILYYQQERFADFGTPSDGNKDAFSGTYTITGATSSATGAPDDGADSAVDTGDSTVTFTNGFANEEIEHDSGNILYTESRRPISRASDQTEDIKLIIEF